jgi:multidrug efflux pump subunit AcrA (membrane-fusion protein)
MNSEEARSPEERLNELKLRYGKLHEEKISAEANHKNALERLEELREEAREKYQTEDIEELKTKLAEMRRENEEKLRIYEASLTSIEKQLSQVKKGEKLEGSE